MNNPSPSDAVRFTKISTVPVKLILSALLILCLTLVSWCIFGTVTDKEYLQGVVFPSQGTISANIPNSGKVENIFVHKGDIVTKGQILALVSVDGARSIVSSPIDGVVLSYLPNNYSFNAFENIVDILSSDLSVETVRNVTAYSNFASKRDLKPGQVVQVTPSNEKREEVGYVHGHIRSVSQYPTSKQDALIKLRNPSLVQEIFPDDNSVFEVEIELDVKADNPSKLDWSFSDAKEIDMGVGTFCHVEVITKSRSFFEYLMENARQSRNKLKLWAGK